MAIQVARVLTDDPSWVHVYGEPSDVEFVMGKTDATGVMIAGYDVKNMGDAQHDGQEALRFTLTADNREVGRLVIMKTATEYTFEFDAEFNSEAEAAAFVEQVKNPPAAPVVVESIQDFAYEGDLMTELANMSAVHGVSLTVIDPQGPGGGWPVVKVVGLVENVRKALTADDGYGWGFMPIEADGMMRPVTA